MSAAHVSARAPRVSISGLLGTLGRSRELTLVAVIVILSPLVNLQAPNFLTTDNLVPVTTLAAIIAIAAVGESLIVITKNVDLSVESTIGLVAFMVGDLLRSPGMSVPEAWAIGLVVALLAGAANGVVVTLFRVPSIVVTLGTLSIYRGIVFVIAHGTQINLSDLPDGYSDPANQTVLGIPYFVVVALVVVAVAAIGLKYTRFGRWLYAVGSDAAAASVMGIRSNLVVLGAFTLAGLLYGIAGILWGIEFGTIYATSASNQALQVIAAVVVGGVAISGGSGTVVGAAIGALFLALINNALLLLQLPQELLQAIYGGVILIAVGADAYLRLRATRAQAAATR